MPDATVHSRVIRSLEEHKEVMEELEGYDGSPESHTRLAQELIDLIISAGGALVVMGVDIAEELVKKLEIIFTKYNPVKHQELVESGLTHEEAQIEQKKRWRS